ncbi:MAG: lysophospholipid acyltransferase family protein [Bacteroidia bacterium]|nr:lysophospholipid acyltransferase family protein [Bacteroidia bacterium]
MIPADKKKWAYILFKAYLRWILKSDFYAIYCQNIPSLIPSTENLILAPNHASWWDGFFAFQLNEWFFRRDFYLLMLESSLKKYPFFQKLGACSIQPDSPKEIIHTIRYLSELLNTRQNVLLTIYPQGILLPDIQPIQTKIGMTKLTVTKPVKILPVYTRTEPLNNRKPTVFVRFGNLINFEDYQKNPQLLEEELNQTRLDCLNHLILSQSYERDCFREL